MDDEFTVQVTVGDAAIPLIDELAATDVGLSLKKELRHSKPKNALRVRLTLTKVLGEFNYDFGKEWSYFPYNRDKVPTQIFHVPLSC